MRPHSSDWFSFCLFDIPAGIFCLSGLCPPAGSSVFLVYAPYCLYILSYSFMLHPAGIFGLCSSWVLLYSLPLVYVPSWVYSVFLVYCYISSIPLDPLVYVLLFYDPSCCIVCLFGLCYVLFMFHLAGILS